MLEPSKRIDSEKEERETKGDNRVEEPFYWKQQYTEEAGKPDTGLPIDVLAISFFISLIKGNWAF